MGHVTEISIRKKERVILNFLSGESSVNIAKLLDMPTSQVSKILSEYVKEIEMGEPSRVKQAKIIEIEMFRAIKKAELSKLPEDIKREDSLIKTYVNFCV